MTFNRHRLGRFRVTFKYLEDVEREMWTALMNTVIILHAEVDPASRYIEYIAYSEQFSELAETAVIPNYVAEWNREEGRFVWQR